MLSVAPHFEIWRSEEFGRLTDRMEQLWQATQQTDLLRVEDLRLSPTATLHGPVPGEFQLTTQALRQLCKRLSIGLYPLLRSLSGLEMVEGDTPAMYNIRTATEVYNTVLGLRFDARLRGSHRAFWDLHAAQLTGVVGLQYVQYPNHSLLELIDSLLVSITPAVHFREAWRVGRQLILRFVSVEPLFTIPWDGKEEVWHGGLHIENEETGEYSVRICPVLWHARTGGYVLDAKGIFRAAHTGKKFLTKLRQLIYRALAKYQELPDFRAQLLSLTRTPFPVRLGQPGIIRAWSQLMLRLGVEYSWCRGLLRQIGEATLFGGGEPLSDLELQELKFLASTDASLLPPRMAYDFLQQLLHTSLTRSIYMRLQLEYVAKLVTLHLRSI